MINISYHFLLGNSIVERKNDMENLKLIDNELVPVYETDNGIKIVDGRELHAVLESKQDFSTWIKKRLNECDAIKNKDYSTAPQIYGTGNGGHSTRLEYTILLDTAKEMAMLERNEKGKRVRRYFIKIENKYKESQQSPLTLQQQIQLVAKGTDELYQRVDGIKNELETLKNDLPILPIEAEKITNAVKAKGVHTMGGKSSNAYRNRSIVNAVYRDIYSQIYRNFGISSYKALKRNQTDKAIEIVMEYKPPVILQDRIENENAQMVLNLKGGAVS